MSCHHVRRIGFYVARGTDGFPLWKRLPITLAPPVGSYSPGIRNPAFLDSVYMETECCRQSDDTFCALANSLRIGIGTRLHRGEWISSLVVFRIVMDFRFKMAGHRGQQGQQPEESLSPTSLCRMVDFSWVVVDPCLLGRRSLFVSSIRSIR